MLLKIDGNTLLLDGTEISGVFQHINISDSIQVNIDSSIGDGLTHHNFKRGDNKTISMSLKILPKKEETVYQQIKSVEKIFMAQLDTNKFMKISNEHINARGIDYVVFSKFDSSENNSTDIVEITLQFEAIDVQREDAEDIRINQ